MLNEYPELTKTLTGSVWLITEPMLQTIVEIVNMRLSGTSYSDEEIRLRLEAKEEARNGEREQNPRIEIAGGVGLTSIAGPIFPKANLMTMLSGATSLETFSNDLRELADNEQVKQIVIDFDTPGGVSDMVEETGQLIKEISADKPIYGLANTEAGSAGLWLLSQTTKAYATPSGRVGSLGAFTVHTDVSKLDEAVGRKITYISAGKYKTAGNPHEPLSREAEGIIQADIDELYSDFRNAVAEGRDKSIEEVEENFGQGRMLSARKAQEVGMIDGVVSMKDFLGNLVTQNMSNQTTSVMTDLSRSVRRMKILHSGGKELSTTVAEGADGVELESSEPGDVYPHVDLNPDDSAGSRYPTRPEDNDVDRTQSDEQTLDVQLRELLGLGEDGDILTAVTELKDEVGPLHELAQQSAAKQAFAQMYPDQAKELERLRQKDIKTEAEAFGTKYAGARIKDKEGNETDKGFSALALSSIVDLHKNFALGTPSLADFEKVLEAITDKGIVQYGEVGSTGSQSEPSSVEGATPRIQFANAVKRIMDNDEVSYEEAIKLASEQYPELAKGYAQHVHVS